MGDGSLQHRVPVGLSTRLPLIAYRPLCRLAEFVWELHAAARRIGVVDLHMFCLESGDLDGRVITGCGRCRGEFVSSARVRNPG